MFKTIKFRIFFSILFLAVLIGAGNWSLAKPIVKFNDKHIVHFVSWIPCVAPGDTNILLAWDDDSHLKDITDKDIDRIKSFLAKLSKISSIYLDIGDIKAENLKWLTSQIAFLGTWPQGDKPFAFAAILGTKDDKNAEDFLKTHFGQLKYRISNGYVYISNSDEVLKNLEADKDFSLINSPKFANNVKKLRYKQNGLMYVDVDEVSYKFFESFINSFDSLGEHRDILANSGELKTLLDSIQCVIAGEEFVGEQLIGEAFLIADVANSGPLGKVIFNPKYNIAHPNIVNHSSSAVFCHATNIFYDYDVLYALLGIHPITSYLREYPEFIFSEYGINLKKDIFENLLNGSLVFSAELPSERDAKILSEQISQIFAHKSEDKIEKSSEDIDTENLYEVCMNILQKTPWKISIGLRSDKAMERLASKVPSFNHIIDGDLVRDMGDTNNASLARWAFLPATKILGNSLWMSSRVSYLGPIEKGNSLGKTSCWRKLCDIGGVRNSVMQWAGKSITLNNSESHPIFGLSELGELIYGERTTNCGTLSITPEGLYLCEVVENSN